MEALIEAEYAQGFITQVASDTLPPGLSETVVRAISERKREPDWMLQKRLEAYRHWLTMDPPNWAEINHQPIDFQQISYYSSPKPAEKLESLDQVDPEILATYEKLGISIEEQKALAGVAVDAVFDSVSVATTFRERLAESGVIFCAI
jgi:Fe-S cluster assembly protein SufB